MRASIKLSSVFTSVLLAGTMVSAATKAPSQAVAKAAPAKQAAPVPVKQDENALNSAAIQKLLSAIKSSACSFELESGGIWDLKPGANNKPQNPLKSFDVDCTIQLTEKRDINFSLLQSAEEKSKDGFDTVLNFQTKGMTLQLVGKKNEDGSAGLYARFYSGFDVSKNAWVQKPLVVTVSVMNGDQVLSSEIVALRFSAIDIEVHPNPKNPDELIASGKCKAEKKGFIPKVGRVEFSPALCVLEGSYEPNVSFKYKFEFKNATATKTVLP